MLSRKTTVPTSTVIRLGSYTSAPESGSEEIIQLAEIGAITVSPDGKATAYVSLTVNGMDGVQDLTYNFQYSPGGGDIFSQIEIHLVKNEGFIK